MSQVSFLGAKNVAGAATLSDQSELTMINHLLQTAPCLFGRDLAELSRLAAGDGSVGAEVVDDHAFLLDRVGPLDAHVRITVLCEVVEAGGEVILPAPPVAAGLEDSEFGKPGRDRSDRGWEKSERI